MTVLSDKWIKRMAKTKNMIKPFISKQKRKGKEKQRKKCIVNRFLPYGRKNNFLEVKFKIYLSMHCTSLCKLHS